jgi:hypothetical protein
MDTWPSAAAPATVVAMPVESSSKTMAAAPP